MATLTQTPAEMDFDATATCDYCLQPAVVRNMVHLVVHQVPLDLCHIDAAYIGRRPVHERARIIRRLVRLYGGAQGEAGGDGDDPDGGPAAPSAARPVALALVAAHAAPAWVELGPADEALLDHFEQVVAESRDPLPCDGCGRPASPAVETDEGLVLCLSCGEGPSAPPAARSAVRDVRFCQTARRLAAARLARQMTAAGVA